MSYFDYGTDKKMTEVEIFSINQYVKNMVDLFIISRQEWSRIHNLQRHVECKRNKSLVYNSHHIENLYIIEMRTLIITNYACKKEEK